MYIQYVGRRVPQEGHMATAEQMALVALQFRFSSVAHCPPLLMPIVSVTELHHV